MRVKSRRHRSVMRTRMRGAPDSLAAWHARIAASPIKVQCKFQQRLNCRGAQQLHVGTTKDLGLGGRIR